MGVLPFAMDHIPPSEASNVYLLAVSPPHQACVITRVAGAGSALVFEENVLVADSITNIQLILDEVAIIC